MKFQLLLICFLAFMQMLYLIIFICIIMLINVKMITMLVPEMYEHENILTFLSLA